MRVLSRCSMSGLLIALLRWCRGAHPGWARTCPLRSTRRGRSKRAALPGSPPSAHRPGTGGRRWPPVP